MARVVLRHGLSVIIVVATLAGAASAHYTVPFAVRVALGSILVLLLPGLSLSLAIFGAALSWVERVLLAVAFSLAIDALVGTALSVTSTGLHVTSWVTALGAITLALLTVAIVRGNEVALPPMRMTRPAASLIAIIGLSTLVVALAIAVDRQPRRPPSSLTGYTLLTLVRAGKDQYRIGIKSGEFSSSRYRIDVYSASRLRLRSWRIGDLPAGGSWVRSIVVPRGYRLDVYLYREGETKPYRHTFVLRP